MVAVRLVTVPARTIVNLTSPRCPAEVATRWRGRAGWHDERYEPLRDLIERTYVDAFDAANGHYRRLEENILANGIRNPVMLVSGGTRRRRQSELPPRYRGRRDVLVSEYLGGSRLYVATKHDMDVPAIVNDFAGLFPTAPRITTEEELAACFVGRPGRLQLTEANGAMVNDLAYLHLPAGYSLRAQVRVRARIMHRVQAVVVQWLRENDG